VAVRPDGRVAENIAVGPHPHDTAVVAGRTFVGDEGAAAVTVVQAGRVTATLPVAVQPGGLAAVGDHMLAVVSVRERVLELFDARTLKRIARVGAGIGPTHVVAANGYVFVTDTSGGALLVFRLRPALRLINRVYLPGAPYGIALDRAHGRLWITLTARNQLVEMRAQHRPAVLVRLPTVRQPNTVAVDGLRGRVFVAGRRAGVVELITP
jgi:DNA-binding beta-propeller fold protein YncE